jgi:hypothetical protein
MACFSLEKKLGDLLGQIYVNVSDIFSNLFF